MPKEFTVVLIKRTKLEEPEGYIERDNLTDVAYYSWPTFIDDEDQEDLYLTSMYNVFCWEKLKEIMKLDEDVDDWIVVGRDDIRELKSCLQQSLSDPELDEIDREDCESGLEIVQKVLKEYQKYHVILADYS